jgi:hypothetical protein
MSSLTSTLAASITASHSNIHALRPATLLVRPLPSPPTPCSKSTKPAEHPTTYRPATPPSSYLSLSLHTSRQPGNDPANSPTHRHHLPFTHHLSPGPGPFLNPNPTRPITDVIDNRTSQTPPDTIAIAIPEQQSAAHPQVHSLPRRLSHLNPTDTLPRHAHERLPYPPIHHCYSGLRSMERVIPQGST